MWRRLLTLSGLVVVTAKIHEPRAPSNPIVAYFDGSEKANECQSRLERRVIGLSGLLMSHDSFGRTPYNRSLNCFLTIAVPKGYRIRIRVVQFDVLVNGEDFGPSGGQCNKDSLHVLDHEKEVEPTETHSNSSLGHPPAPGPIIAQLCGKIRNQSEYVVSSLNALSLWWHTDQHLRKDHEGRGFQLHWSAFRVPKGKHCDSKEFRCTSDECIPIDLVCNSYADCKDSSDTLSRHQEDAHCSEQYAAGHPSRSDVDIPPLSGPLALLLSASVCGLVLCCCVGSCVCVHCVRKQTRKPQSKGLPTASVVSFTPHQTSYAQTESGRCGIPRAVPMPPAIYPPSPPKMPPPSAVSDYTPKREAVRGYAGKTGKVVLFSDAYPPENHQPVTANNGEYIYVHNEQRHKLL